MLNTYFRVIVGTMVLLSVVLSVYVSPNWMWFTVFIGLNLIQSAFTSIAFRLSKKSSFGETLNPSSNNAFMFLSIAIFGATLYDFKISFTLSNIMIIISSYLYNTYDCKACRDFDYIVISAIAMSYINIFQNHMVYTQPHLGEPHLLHLCNELRVHFVLGYPKRSCDVVSTYILG